MPFVLTFLLRVHPQSERYSSRIGAIARAYIALESRLCHSFRIESAGELVMDDAAIMAACREAGLLMHPGT